MNIFATAIFQARLNYKQCLQWAFLTTVIYWEWRWMQYVPPNTTGIFVALRIQNTRTRSYYIWPSVAQNSPQTKLDRTLSVKYPTNISQKSVTISEVERGQGADLFHSVRSLGSMRFVAKNAYCSLNRFWTNYLIFTKPDSSAVACLTLALADQIQTES
jgi:hypothetical protein